MQPNGCVEHRPHLKLRSRLMMSPPPRAQVIKRSSKKTQARRSSMKVGGAPLPGTAGLVLAWGGGCTTGQHAGDYAMADALP